MDGIKTIIDDMPTYGYRRVHAILCRRARSESRPWPNAKRAYRVMKVHGMLLQRHTGALDTRRHDGRVAVEQSNLHWCSDGFEIACDNKEKVRVAFALGCCDREAIAHVATTEGIRSEDVQDLIITAVENRFGLINALPKPFEWLTETVPASSRRTPGHCLSISALSLAPRPFAALNPMGWQRLSLKHSSATTSQ